MIKVIVCENYDEISKVSAQIVAKQINEKPDSILGLATGSTPIGTYKELIKMNKEGEIDFSKIKTFNLDEYYPIKQTDDQSYYYFMNENLFSHVNINKENTNIPNGEATDPDAECERYEKAIEESAGVDLQILGIGQNGHIGFNEPDTQLYTKTHLTGLTENTIAANSRFFESEEDVPKAALTMGIETIMKSRKIILLASGKSKFDAVSKLMNDKIDTSCPATMLKLHPDVTLICDNDAFSNFKLGVDIGGTNIKFGVTNNNEIIYKHEVSTPNNDEKSLISCLCDEIKKLLEKFSISKVGIGVPGTIKNGKVTAPNIDLKDCPFGEILTEKLGIEVKIENDANAAALGEATFGKGKNYNNMLMITLGTGIGGGIIIDNKIYYGRGDAGEIGHIIIEKDGIPCNCGQNGCWEKYASAKALTDKAEEKALLNKDSVLYKAYEENNNIMNGKVFFKAVKDGCTLAKEVFDEYLDYLALGIKSLILVYSPDIIVLSGGISNVGDLLLNPLKEKVSKDVPIKVSTLQSDAGIAGASVI